MGRGIKWAIWTFSIITCYQQSFGIIWQLAHMKNLKFFTCDFFFLMGRGIKQAIWTFLIITCYQQSFGIIWQMAHTKTLKFFTSEFFFSNGAWN